MTSLIEKHWFVVQTQPHAEVKAAAHLSRQGFTTYLPRYLKRRRHARRTETVAAPLFPRYIFVDIDMAVQRWRSIHSTVGVSRLVCQGKRTAQIASAIIEQLRLREDESGIIRLEQRPRFKPGETIRVLDGVFTSLLGLYEGVLDNERVTILLDLLGRKVRVAVDLESVAAA
ncbi:MAG: transcriptional activator RfaH [Pseudorhodoplanes sp.]|nr:transcriptional activator RfaH [Pseudorhodoplanes sp.]